MTGALRAPIVGRFTPGRHWSDAARTRPTMGWGRDPGTFGWTL